MARCCPCPPGRSPSKSTIPVKLQATIQKLINAANVLAATHGSPGVQLQQSTVNGRTYYTFSSQSGSPFTQVCYTYIDGYLLAGSSQALLDTAIQNRASGYTLPRSATFTALIPHDQYANFSAADLLQRQHASPAARTIQPAARRASNWRPI